MIITLSKLLHCTVLERPLIIKYKLLAVVRFKRDKSDSRVFHKNLQN